MSDGRGGGALVKGAPWEGKKIVKMMFNRIAIASQLYNLQGEVK